MSAVRVTILENQSDPGAALALRQRVADALGTGRQAIVLDLRGATFAGTSAVCELCCALRQLARPEVRITVVGASPHVCSVLGLCEVPGVVIGEGPRPAAPERLAPAG